MTIREDNREIVDLIGKIEFTDKKIIRDFLLDTWKIESPGKQYRYFVEMLDEKKRIYLERPGQLNKGCDFVIFVEDFKVWKNGNDKPPKHDDILKELKKKARSNKNKFNRLIKLIESVYNCEPLEDILTEANRFSFSDGWSNELVLKLLKWFFIEQDITYWNRTGRDMLWKGIREI